MDQKREVLRHMVATVGFRGRIAISGAAADFADFRIAGLVRSPAEILAHIGDLLVGSYHLLREGSVSLDPKPLPWDEEKARFFTALRRLDDFLAGDEPLLYPVEKFVQGPIGDALTHVGQIVMLRRIAGVPIREESYFTAEIVPGSFDWEAP
jgi:hypothetical protein